MGDSSLESQVELTDFQRYRLNVNTKNVHAIITHQTSSLGNLQKTSKLIHQNSLVRAKSARAHVLLPSLLRVILVISKRKCTSWMSSKLRISCWFRQLVV